MNEENRNNESEVRNKANWIPLLRQIRVCFTLCSLFFVSGIYLGTPTVVRPQLIKEANTTLAVNDNMYSWINSVSSFSGSASVFILTFIAHLFGRKKTTLLITINMVVASTILYCSYSPVHILISQLISGVLLGGIITVFPLIITEYSSTKYRGIFLTLKSATLFWGIWTANSIGIFTNYRYIGGLAFVISTVALIMTFFMPESPFWLASKGKYEECALAHRLLKGDDEKVQQELEDLISAQKIRRENNKPKPTIIKYLKKYFTLLKEPGVGKPIAISLLLFAMYESSGKMICAIYALEIMKKLTTTESESHIAVLVLDGFSVLGMYIGCGMSKILKRRTMLLVNSSIGAIFLFVMSLYLYLIKLSILSENPYLITALLVGYSLAICCGPMILLTSIFGELLPMKSRSFTVCVISSLYLAVSGIVSKIAPFMFNFYGIHGTFLSYGISFSVCIILAYKYLPETKDKSLYEIAAIFAKKTVSEPAETYNLLDIKTVR